MKYDWSKVTDEKRAKLFPIILEKHNAVWAEIFLKEKKFVERLLKKKILFALVILVAQL